MRAKFARGVAIAIIVFALVFGAEFFFEYARAGYPPFSDMSWAHDNPAKLADMLSPMARAYNNVLAMMLAMVGFAIPLTASMHSPKLIEFFLRDTINRVVLAYLVFGAAHVLWAQFMIGPHFAPTISVATAVIGAIVGWALLLPYLFYILRFIDPSHLLGLLRGDAMKIVAACADRRHDPDAGQRELAARVSQLGTMLVKSLDRNDRENAAQAAWSMKVLLDHYDKHKSRMPKEWFVVDRGDFTGFSDDALEMMSENRTWYEMKCLQQLELGFLRALKGADDTISTISDATRVIACRAHEHHDEQALRLCVRFFNTYLREAIKARHLRAVYDVFHNYRKLARDLVDRPELLVEIGHHFRYYAQMARLQGIVFAPQLAVFDLGYVTRRAYERASPAAARLLDDVLGLPHRTGEDIHTMAVKAKLILGSFFVANKLPSEAEQVRRNLSDIDADQIERAEAELLAADRSFFEVTDRQLNLEYIPADRRDALQAFCDALAARFHEED